MTIKKRFLISYLSAILITLGSIFLIFAIISYTTLGEVPSFPRIYRILTTQRPLTEAESESYTAMNSYLEESSEQLELPLNQELLKTIKEIEQNNLNVVLRKDEAFTYYSNLLVEKSLQAHAPAFDLHNFEPTGTIDNNGHFFHYVKKDFRYADGAKGSFVILKRESNLIEFFLQWGIWVILFIIGIAIFAFWFINRRLSKTTIQPLLALEKSTRKLTSSDTISPFITDDTEEHVSKEVQQLQESFAKMWADLQQSQAEQEKYETNRRELISNISHDLKTPMTSITGYVEGLIDGVANTEEKRQRYLKTIHEKSITLNELIDELFLYSKLDLNAVAFHFKKIDFIAYMKHLLEEYLWTDDIKVTTDFPNQAIYAAIDPIQFNRVITNLIQNSMKFRNPQQTPEFHVGVTCQSSQIMLTFTDNGIGISEEDLANIFERFYRTDKARTSTIKGSGLGLSIVKQIVEHHSGNIQVASQLGKGTTITITLPLLEEKIQ
ncbi:sensor histidine kinase [Candidatus Enterococcus willemsii]|uniref:histidine kinase n=1 Tax=Candidatus Enterococcus willemsii TaxID=1857215 RepID=A0ABQ6Z1F5_9ENTE|nr:HAMP domain-containing sensor histidine kinase [Enterococcus sp. CU12B]KAF1305063.1 two-component sensor histidine kinase [Enterococcus sp. CU12B]